MKSKRIDVGAIRREEIVDAAWAIIAEQGLQNLSLSEIETRAKMSRGQLTYYFKTKEQILLAVFDRMVRQMRERAAAGHNWHGDTKPTFGWDCTRMLFEKILLHPPEHPEFAYLQYTFLSQLGHCEEYRERLATLYEEWRSHMALGLAGETGGKKRRPSMRAVSTLIQAIIHGLVMQLAADPNAFDREEMFHLCIDVLGSYLELPTPVPQRNGQPTKKPRKSRG
jgi:AcrR family transcriptional regulator